MSFVKIMFEFEDEIFDTFWLSKVERIDRWNDIDCVNEYGIIFNKEDDMSNNPIRNKSFFWEDEGVREAKLIDLKNRLTNLPNVKVL